MVVPVIALQDYSGSVGCVVVGSRFFVHFVVTEPHVPISTGPRVKLACLSNRDARCDGPAALRFLFEPGQDRLVFFKNERDFTPRLSSQARSMAGPPPAMTAVDHVRKRSNPSRISSDMGNSRQMFRERGNSRQDIYRNTKPSGVNINPKYISGSAPACFVPSCVAFFSRRRRFPLCPLVGEPGLWLQRNARLVAICRVATHSIRCTKSGVVECVKCIGTTR